MMTCQALCRKSMIRNASPFNCRLPSSLLLLTHGLPAVLLLNGDCVWIRRCQALGINFSEFVKDIKYNFALQQSDLTDTAYFISAALRDC